MSVCLCGQIAFEDGLLAQNGTVAVDNAYKGGNNYLPSDQKGSLGRTAQDGHLDSHTAPELCAVGHAKVTNLMETGVVGHVLSEEASGIWRLVRREVIVAASVGGAGECSCPGSTFCSTRISVSVPSPCYRSSM